jgi:mono/diheme cytochrome c family protein
MKNKSILLLFVLLYGITSCSSDDGITDKPVELVTFTGTVKAIMNNHCVSCHASSPINGAPMPLVTLEEVKEAVQNRNLVGRIEDGSMPPDPAPDLSAEEIQAIKDWRIGNFKE